MEQEEIEELMTHCNRLRELVQAIAQAMDYAEKRLQRIERQGKIWRLRAYGNERGKNED